MSVPLAEESTFNVKEMMRRAEAAECPSHDEIPAISHGRDWSNGGIRVEADYSEYSHGGPAYVIDHTPPAATKSDREVRLQQEAMANREVCDGLCELLNRKNANYGRNLPRHGLKGVVIRISDKTMRLENLVLDPENVQNEVSESVEDTLLDLAGYCIKSLALIKLGDLTLEGNWKYQNGIEGFVHKEE